VTSNPGCVIVLVPDTPHSLLVPSSDYFMTFYGVGTMPMFVSWKLAVTREGHIGTREGKRGERESMAAENG